MWFRGGLGEGSLCPVVRVRVQGSATYVMVRERSRLKSDAQSFGAGLRRLHVPGCSRRGQKVQGVWFAHEIAYSILGIAAGLHGTAARRPFRHHGVP